MTFISKFTPSIGDAETLEAIFVQRQGLAERRIECIRESVLTPAKHYALLIGPRGIGKTHFVALIYHRIRAMEEIRGRIAIAWLQEEEWGAASYLDVLLKILAALADEYSDGTLRNRIDRLYEQTPSVAQSSAAKMLIEYLDGRTLLLLAENLDELFMQIRPEGQKRLRSFLQEEKTVTILATAQSLTGAFTLQTSPFYGFFTTYNLTELSHDETAELIRKIALRNGDRDLAEFVLTPQGRARLRALRHLAGGNHRVYVILSEFLTRESLDHLVDPFLEMLDGLTPYYQDRMRVLSPQQRKVVEFLCGNGKPAQVKEIAKRCFMSHQTASSQLGALRRLGYVVDFAVGRDVFYELREPLMRLVFEVKRSRGGPIGLFVDFLRLWYSPVELREQLSGLDDQASLEKLYLSHAIARLEAEPDPLVATCEREYYTYRDAEDYKNALKVTEELLCVRGSGEDLRERGFCLFHLGETDEAISILERAVDFDRDDHSAWAYLAQAKDKVGDHTSALDAVSNAIRLHPKCVFSMLVEIDIRVHMNDTEGALAVAHKAARIDPKNPYVLSRLAYAYLKKRDNEKALGYFDQLVELDPSYTGGWMGRGSALMRLGQYAAAVSCFETVISSDSKDTVAFMHRGTALARLREFSKAADSVRDGLCRGLDVGCAPFLLLEYLIRSGRVGEIGESCSRVLNHCKGDDEHAATHSALVIEAMLETPGARVYWPQVQAFLMDQYRKAGLLAVLGYALVTTTKVLVSGQVSNSDAAAWLESWNSISTEASELVFPMRVLTLAVRWKHEQDPRVLLELPTEQRKVLESVIGVGW